MAQKKTAAHSGTNIFPFSKTYIKHLLKGQVQGNWWVIISSPITLVDLNLYIFLSKVGVFRPPQPWFADTEEARRSSLSRTSEPWCYVVLYQGWPTFHDLHDKKDMRRPWHTPFFVPKRDKVDDKAQDDHNFLWVSSGVETGHFVGVVFTSVVEGC